MLVPTSGPSQGRTSLLPWGFVVVRGPSMGPLLRDGDRLLVHWGAAPRPGSVVVARLADGTIAIKRATERRGAGWWVLGDDPERSVDSRHRGPVADDDLWGVAVARVWPRPRRGLAP